MFGVLFEQAADGQRYIDWLLSGLGWTLALAFFGWWIAVADGVIVGSDLKVDGSTWNPVDAERAERFMAQVRRAR